MILFNLNLACFCFGSVIRPLF